jgi:VWFA-related protein
MGMTHQINKAIIFFLLSGFCAITTDSQSPAPAPQASPQQAAAPAQQQPAQPQQKRTVFESATVLRATTRLVVLDVVATNNKGEAITDLKKEDFTVMEDGKPQEVAVFSFQHPAPAGTAPLEPIAMQLPANVFTNVPRFNVNNALSVILLDALNATTLNQAQAREAMLKYLARIPAGQPVAVYTLGSKLQMVQDFTTDPSELKKVISNLKIQRSPVQDSPTGNQEQVLPSGVFEQMTPQMQQQVMQFEQERVSFQTDIRVQLTLSAMGALARTLAGYPGRKNLIWISETFPLNINPNTTLSGDIFASARNYAPQIAQAAQSLIDAQVAVYPVDARGLATPAVYQASTMGQDKFGRPMGRNPGMMSQGLSDESSELQASHSTMQEVAERTGGKAFYNSNDLEGAIGKSIEDGSTYYTVAYYPANKEWNGKFRKISVKVNRSGVKLRNRLGYYGVDPKTAGTLDAKQQGIALGDALNPGMPISTGLRFEARVLPPSEKSQNKVVVDFIVDPHGISFELKPDGAEYARVEFVVQAYTRAGKALQPETAAVEYALPADAFKKVMQIGVRTQKVFDLAPGEYFLRLAVRDTQ